MKRTILTLTTLLLFAAPAFAQDLPEPQKISGHFKVKSGAMAKKLINVYLVTGLHYKVQIGDDWYDVKRGSHSEDTLVGGPGTSDHNGALGAAGNLDNPGGGTTAANSSSDKLTLKIVAGPVKFPDGSAGEVWTFSGSLKQGSKTTKFTLERRILIPPKNPTASDKGFSGKIGKHIRDAPAYPDEGTFKGVFWAAWGPVFHRGRLNGKARFIGIASDPGPTESLPFVRRSLVGDAGQRTQGFLEKLGLTHSYTLVNAFTYPTRPSKVSVGRTLFSKKEDQLKWRNDYYDMLYTKSVQGICLFGGQAEKAFKMWNKSRMKRGLPDVTTEVTVVKCSHPSSGRGDWNSFASTTLARTWREAIEKLRKVITPDDKKLAAQPNFGEVFSEVDYAEIPPGDLPKGSQKYYWVRDNSWSRSKVKGRRNNSVKRIGSLNMELDFLDGSQVFIRANGRDSENPNATPKFLTFTKLNKLVETAMASRFGDDARWIGHTEGKSNNAYKVALKYIDSSWRPEADVIARLDKSFPVTGTPDLPLGPEAKIGGSLRDGYRATLWSSSNKSTRKKTGVYLSKGTKVTVVSTKGNYKKVKTAAGDEGWVYKRFVEE